MTVYTPVVAESVAEALDEALEYIEYISYREYAARFLEDYRDTLLRLRDMAGILPYHRLPRLAAMGYKEIRFRKHDWYLLFTVEGSVAQVKVLANDAQDIDALVRD